MSREDYDIPEVFRRAMEEAGWDTGRKGDDGGDRPPFPQRPEGNGRSNWLLWLTGIIIALLLLFSWLVNVYTDWLWFTAVGFSDVWLTQWLVRLGIFAGFFLAALLIFLLNWHLARRRAIKATPPFNPKFLQIPGIGWLLTGASILLAFGFASSITARWGDLLRYFFRVPFGVADPIFDQDISFYLFELPVFTLVQQWAVSMLVIALIGTIIIYAVNHTPEIQRGTWRPHESKVFRRHVALLATLILGLWTVGYVFDLYELLYSTRGDVFGASYTDLNAEIYAIYAQMITMGLATLAMLFNVFRFDLRPLFITGGLWLTATLVLGGILPGFVQRYSVEPNELNRERPYIQNNINFTRLGFGLNEVQVEEYDLGAPLTEQDLDRNVEILKNIRLWDNRPLGDSYRQLQELRTYYEFENIDIDRYEINGETRQVMLAARELNQRELENQTWINLNLIFTHGYGIVMNPVDEFTSEGQPEFYIKDIPPQSTVEELTVTRPQIYYGELESDVVYVASRQDEFDYPEGSGNVVTRYAGAGGVQLDSFFKRLAFAIRMGDFNVLLSNDIDDNTRVLWHRNIKDRVNQITPFLMLDNDPYLVVTDDGRLVWVLDAYTLSNRFPYSEPEGLRIGNREFNINYIRNAVKITVDAYDGTINYYIADEEDPIIQTYARVFPGVFQPLSNMPEDLRSHLRYPLDFFSVQTKQYLRYHMTDTDVFYNQEDVWEIPKELFTSESSAGNESTNQPVNMEPYFVTMPLPGEVDPEYLLIQPYTPIGKDKNNMIAWLAARNDEPNYGELIVYELPKQELVFGPLQIESRIDQQTEISQQFTLWNQSGSSVIRGNLLVIPMNGRFLYVEPIYLQSQSSALPELKRVIVATDSRIAMDTTLGGALAALLEEEPEDIAEVIREELEPEAAPATELDEQEIVDETTPDVSIGNDEISVLIQSANAHFEAAQQAQQAGDWATYGEELDALEQDLARLMELREQSP